MKLNRYLLSSTVVAATGSFLFGFDTAVISGTTTALRQVFGLSSGQLGFTVASALIGTILGSMAAGKPVEGLGRKRTLMGLAFLYVISSLGCGLAWNWVSLLTFRFLGGIAIGIASVVSPMYIAEIAPPESRGRLVAVSQLTTVLGILVAYLTNYLITLVFTGGPADAVTPAWRWMFGILALPSALFFFLVLPIPESPRWLVKRKRIAEALSVLRQLGNQQPESLVEEIVASLKQDQQNTREPFFVRKYRRPILLAMMVATFNQLTGINALIYYTADIFRMAGAQQTSALLQSVLIGLTCLLSTALAMTVIDNFGRKRLLMIGAIGMAVCLSITAFGFYQHRGGGLVLTSLMGYIAFFAFSQGSVIWVFLSEIFPNRVRAQGQALGCFTHWMWCAVVSWMFPIIAEQSGGHAFSFFAAMMLLQCVLVWKFLPETKGVSLEHIQRILGIA